MKRGICLLIYGLHVYTYSRCASIRYTHYRTCTLIDAVVYNMYLCTFASCENKGYNYYRSVYSYSCMHEGIYRLIAHNMYAYHEEHSAPGRAEI